MERKKYGTLAFCFTVLPCPDPTVRNPLMLFLGTKISLGIETLTIEVTLIFFQNSVISDCDNYSDLAFILFKDNVHLNPQLSPFLSVSL